MKFADRLSDQPPDSLQCFRARESKLGQNVEDMHLLKSVLRVALRKPSSCRYHKTRKRYIDLVPWLKLSHILCFRQSRGSTIVLTFIDKESPFHFESQILTFTTTYHGLWGHSGGNLEHQTCQFGHTGPSVSHPTMVICNTRVTAHYNFLQTSTSCRELVALECFRTACRCSCRTET
jgi:hypothetical protein